MEVLFYELQYRKGTDIDTLASVGNSLIKAANGEQDMRAVYTSFKADAPQLVVKIDREKVKNLGVQISDVFSTLQIFLGSQYINDFDMDNRVYRVYVQADQLARANPKDIEQFYVRSNRGMMVPLSNFVQVSRFVSPPLITHYNMFRSVEINGNSAPGFSSGQAMQTMKQL